MSKIKFSKVEKSFDKAIEKLHIDNLSELAIFGNAIQNTQVSNKTVEEVIVKFQKELKRIKKEDPNLFNKLNLTPEEELRLDLPYQEYKQEDWLRIRNLKVRIDELKHELTGKESLNEENDHQIAKERRRHVNKRFNIRDGWLPLK